MLGVGLGLGWRGGGGKGGVDEYAGKRPWRNIVMLLHLVDYLTCCLAG